MQQVTSVCKCIPQMRSADALCSQPVCVTGFVRLSFDPTRRFWPFCRKRRFLLRVGLPMPEARTDRKEIARNDR